MDRSWLIDVEGEIGIQWTRVFSTDGEEYTEDIFNDVRGMYCIHHTLTNVMVF